MESEWTNVAPKKPKTIDFTPTDGGGKGEQFFGIYQLRKDTRKLCFAPAAKDRPKEFSSTPENEQRDIEEELLMIESIRKHMARILRTLPPDAFQRKVNHSEDGPITLQTLLERITNHIPHHVQFIEEKRRAMEAGG